MNLVNFKNVYEKNEKDEGFFFTHEWREQDFKKIDKIILEIFEKIKKLDPNYEYTIESLTNISPYLGDFASYYTDYKITQTYEKHTKDFSFLVPKLLQKNYFMLNKTLYVPLMFLEKAPIDKVVGDNKLKIYANLNPEYNFTLDFVNKLVFFRSKKIPIDLFLRIIYHDDLDKLLELDELELITSKKFTKAEKETFIKFLGFHKKEFFNDIDMVEFIDDYLILDYYKELFNDYFGISTIKEIIWKIIEIYKNGTDIDMADIKNRRVVLSEYLIRPVFELYLRLLYGIVDKRNNNFLPSMNPNVSNTTGFGNLMHRGNLYDIALPYPSPLINKISQDITIIKSGRLPKSWVRNDISTYGIICPVSVSAQKTSSNIIFTTNTLINYYGRIKFKGL